MYEWFIKGTIPTVHSSVSVKVSRSLLLWQTLFILFNLFWLWAPWLNTTLSDRVSLISQYESSLQPYSLLFRIGDILGGSLLLLMTLLIWRLRRLNTVVILLTCISAGMILDPVLATTCQTVGTECIEYTSPLFYAHTIETIVTSGALLALMLYDAVKNKKITSIITVSGQLVYGVLFAIHLADQGKFNTISQFTYQFLIIIWLAWFCRDYLLGTTRLRPSMPSHAVRYVSGLWVFLSGIVTIMLGLTHIHLLGSISGVYLTQGAWLAQYGVSVGVALVYLSRHLMRGELRARYIVLIILGIEVIKYSVITPQATILYLYLLSFIALFVFGDAFNRGTAYATRRIRLQDLVSLLGGLASAALLTWYIMHYDSRAYHVVVRGFRHFNDFVLHDSFVARHGMASALFAHTATAFVGTGLVGILWALFRPNIRQKPDTPDFTHIRNILAANSTSSEDYFKLWPADKSYYWNTEASGFIAYKRSGSVAFVLADPIGLNPVAQLHQFNNFCKANRLKVCCLPVYQDSVALYRTTGFQLLHIGGSAVIDIATFCSQTSNGKWWRWQRNRAQKSGYTYHASMPPHSPQLMRSLRNVSDAWLKISGHTEHAFSLGYFAEQYIQQCTVHYLADSTNTITAFVTELPQFVKRGIVTIDLLRYQPSQNGTMPYLLYCTLHTLSQDPHNTTFDLGFVPFATARGSLIRIARTLGGKRFSAHGLEQFKNKFDPTWQPNYLAYQGDLADLAYIAVHLERVMKPPVDLP